MSWRRLFGRTSYEAELEKELSFHLDAHTSDLIAEGHTPEEARRRAALALGLGIGVNTTILGAVNGFILRPLPVDAPEGLIATYWGRRTDTQVWGPFSYANYVDLRDRNQSFASLCAWTEISMGVSSSESRSAGGGDRAEVVWGELVSGNYFDVMGVAPLLGRTISPDDDRTPNGHPVVVLSYSLWQRRFDADAAILGKTILLSGHPMTVIGVMPESFLGSRFYIREAFWAPAMMSEQFGRRADWQTARGYAVFNLYGRLRPGLTTAQAEADLNAVAATLASLDPVANTDTKIQLMPELDGRYGPVGKVLSYAALLAVAVSALVLLLACANVANLMLARATTRAREIGIRLAIGAGRGRIVRQLLTESVLLALLGGALGLVFAYWGAGLIRATIPPVPYPLALDFAPDARVLGWMLVISLLTGVLFGLAPALLASRTDLVAVIKGVTTGPSHARSRWNLRGALVIAQVTISIVVLVCAGLFVRSLGAASQADPGFKTENLVTMMLNLDLLAYDHETARRFYPELQQRVESQPGVRRAALTSEMPLMVAKNSRGPIVREAESDPPPNQGVHSECSFVTPAYFETMGTPLVVGRDFTDHDTADAPPVVVVNQEFARRFYGGEHNALGQRFRFAGGTPLMEIVGVAKDGRYDSLYEDPELYMFLPVYQHLRTRMTLVVSARSGGDVQAALDAARHESAALDARLPVYGVMVGDENLSLAYWGPKVAAGMASAFGVLALILATMGLYSVMTYSVSQRTREIGIRMALGAGVREVVRLIVRQGMRMVAIGIVLGLAGALALTRVLSSLLYGVGTTDAVTYVGVSALLVAVAALACYIPARRATRVDPLVALRQD